MRNDRVRCPVPWRMVGYVDVVARARELGCPAPTGVALLPGNFATAASADELQFHDAVPEVRSAWRGVGLKDTGPRRRLRRQAARNPDASGHKVPFVVYFGTRSLGGPSRQVTWALGMIALVLAAKPDPAMAREVRLDALIECPSTDRCACLEYSGDACDLFTLSKAVRRILAQPLADERLGTVSMSEVDDKSFCNYEEVECDVPKNPRDV